MLPLYRNQSINLLSKSIDWLLYDGNIKGYGAKLIQGTLQSNLNIGIPSLDNNLGSSEFGRL